MGNDVKGGHEVRAQEDPQPDPTSEVRAQEDPQPDPTSEVRFKDRYTLKGVLGYSSFSTVRKAVLQSDEYQTYTVKCVNRSKLSKEDEDALVNEAAILRELNHHAIICLYDFFKERKMYYLVLEQMSGGELFDRIAAKSRYKEEEARDTCKIVLEAIKYCHEMKVAHRDLKPENLLLVSRTDDTTVKIANFGFAKKVEPPKKLTTLCGTPGYVAPEILEGLEYDTKADMWSVGVILYILLGGYPPFLYITEKLLFDKIKKGQYEFHPEYWRSASEDAKNLISSLLNVNPDTRLSASEALQHRWIRFGS